MKNLTKLLLLTTSIISTFAMESAPAGVAGGVAAGAVHAGAAAPFDDWMAEVYVPAAAVLPGIAGIALELTGTLSEINKSLPAAPWEDTTIDLNIGVPTQTSPLGMLAMDIEPSDIGGVFQPSIHTLPPTEQTKLFMHRFSDLAQRRDQARIMALIPDAAAYAPNIVGMFLCHAFTRMDASLYRYILSYPGCDLSRMDTETRTNIYLDLGNIFKALQSLIAEGLAKEKYGIPKNHAILRNRADAGWVPAQERVVEGLAKGRYGMRQDHAALRRYADAGWIPAQERVVEGLAEGLYGMTRDLAALRRLAYELKWVGAQSYVADGLADGWFGMTQDLAELRRLADVGWVRAQAYVVNGLATGAYGMTKDLAELKRLADAGWVPAQRCVAHGLATGAYGMTKDPAALRRLAIEHIGDNDSPCVKEYLGLLETFEEELIFMMEATPVSVTADVMASIARSMTVLPLQDRHPVPQAGQGCGVSYSAIGFLTRHPPALTEFA